MALEKHRKNSHAPFVVSGASVTNGTAIDFHKGHGIDMPTTSPHAPNGNTNNLGYGTVPISTYRPVFNTTQQQNTPIPIPLSSIKK